MSIPTLCQACYKHYRSTVVKACPFCDDVHFPEEMWCDLVRDTDRDDADVGFQLTLGEGVSPWIFVTIDPSEVLDAVNDPSRKSLRT
jgi:hypothetical protein